MNIFLILFIFTERIILLSRLYIWVIYLFNLLNRRFTVFLLLKCIFWLIFILLTVSSVFSPSLMFSFGLCSLCTLPFLSSPSVDKRTECPDVPKFQWRNGHWMGNQPAKTILDMLNCHKTWNRVCSDLTHVWAEFFF